MTARPNTPPRTPPTIAPVGRFVPSLGNGEELSVGLTTPVIEVVDEIDEDWDGRVLSSGTPVVWARSVSVERLVLFPGGFVFGSGVCSGGCDLEDAGNEVADTDVELDTLLVTVSSFDFPSR